MPKPPIPKPSRTDVINNLIDSIAQEESSLAEILSAEGEKIEKVVHSNYVDTDTILCVNKSVQSTINAITRLEVLLATKLDSISCEICPQHCKPHKKED